MKTSSKGIKSIIRKCITEAIESPNKDTFEKQDETAEITVGKEKHKWGEGQYFREKVENAGDILRELTGRGNTPDWKYINEKILKLEDWVKKDFAPIPDDIQTLEQFNNSRQMKFSDAIDSREYVARFYPEILQQTITEYEAIPVYTEEAEIAKNAVLSLLKGNKYALKKSIESLKEICDALKADGKIFFVPLSRLSYLLSQKDR